MVSEAVAHRMPSRTMTDNLTRMIALAEEFFATKEDPQQLDITEAVMEQLHALHPAAMGEAADGNGPIAWTIVIPVPRAARDLFLSGAIGETELLTAVDRQLGADGQLPADGDAHLLTSLYLCSALVLPEHRGKGLAKRLVLDSLAAIRADHPIDELIVWAFSNEGNALAQRISMETGLPIIHRK